MESISFTADAADRDKIREFLGEQRFIHGWSEMHGTLNSHFRVEAKDGAALLDIAGRIEVFIDKCQNGIAQDEI